MPKLARFIAEGPRQTATGVAAPARTLSDAGGREMSMGTGLAARGVNDLARSVLAVQRQRQNRAEYVDYLAGQAEIAAGFDDLVRQYENNPEFVWTPTSAGPPGHMRMYEADAETLKKTLLDQRAGTGMSRELLESEFGRQKARTAAILENLAAARGIDRGKGQLQRALQTALIEGDVDRAKSLLAGAVRANLIGAEEAAEREINLESEAAWYEIHDLIRSDPDGTLALLENRETTAAEWPGLHPKHRELLIEQARHESGQRAQAAERARVQTQNATFYEMFAGVVSGEATPVDLSMATAQGRLKKEDYEYLSHTLPARLADFDSDTESLYRADQLIAMVKRGAIDERTALTDVRSMIADGQIHPRKEGLDLLGRVRTAREAYEKDQTDSALAGALELAEKEIYEDIKNGVIAWDLGFGWDSEEDRTKAARNLYPQMMRLLRDWTAAYEGNPNSAEALKAFLEFKEGLIGGNVQKNLDTQAQKVKEMLGARTLGRRMGLDTAPTQTMVRPDIERQPPDVETFERMVGWLMHNESVEAARAYYEKWAGTWTATEPEATLPEEKNLDLKSQIAEEKKETEKNTKPASPPRRWGRKEVMEMMERGEEIPRYIQNRFPDLFGGIKRGE